MADLKVMISSTAIDLPEHRAEAREACLRQGMFPLMMEHMPASPRDAVSESLALVDQASIYLGIFGHRYGFILPGRDVSITEIELQRALERKIPCLIYFMHEDHPLKVADVDRGEAAHKLDALKARLRESQVVDFFRSPEDLRAQVIDSLSRLRQPYLQAFHFVSDIPPLPQPYIAHPYTLLQTKDLVGRQAELNLLTDWVVNQSSEVHSARVLVFVAIGGMGKSALTWKWFREIAPEEMRALAGRLWWSFYESDATFENFVIRALAYVKGISRSEAQALTPSEREEQLLNLLNQRPYLLVLDGLERILVAYARMDAARMVDDDLDERSDNTVLGAIGLEESATYGSRHHLRKTADPRAGVFLRKLAQVRPSRILVTTRLFPAELQTDTGRELPGARAVFLTGLTADDALNLWRAFGVSGSREMLLSLFRSFDNYPLLVRALAGEVAQFRRAPGNFDEWRQANADFDPLSLPLVQRRSHVLSFALRGLSREARKLLMILAAFRMPSAYEGLVALLVGVGKSLPVERLLDLVLTDLEDRGLLGWDRRANRYDLHPVVRGVVWHSLGRTGQRIIYENLQSHFESLPIKTSEGIRSLEDLTPAIELYSSLVGLKEYDAAYKIFQDHLTKPALFKLNFFRQVTEWLEMLFPNGIDQPSALTDGEPNNSPVWWLAYCYYYIGELRKSSSLWESLRLAYKTSVPEMGVIWANLGAAFQSMGELWLAERAFRYSISEADASIERAIKLGRLGWLWFLRGSRDQAGTLLRMRLETIPEDEIYEKEAVEAISFMACYMLEIGNHREALSWAKRGWKRAKSSGSELCLVDAALSLGTVLLGTGDFSEAAAKLSLALTRARITNYRAAEVESLILLAELQLAKGDAGAARELLDDVWDSLERGPFRLLQARAFNVLAEAERALSHRSVACDAVRNAYTRAWCDGPPFALEKELAKAKSLLLELGEPAPEDLAPFDEESHGKLPKVKIPGSNQTYPI